MKSRLVAVTIAAAVTVLVATPLSSAAGATSRTALPFLAVIDAGSSGPRLTLFANNPNTLRPRVAFTAPVTTRGLSSYESTPQQAGQESVAPLLSQLDGYLSQISIASSSVPVSLLATAGMRDVRRENPAAAQAILDSTAQTISPRAAIRPLTTASCLGNRRPLWPGSIQTFSPGPWTEPTQVLAHSRLVAPQPKSHFDRPCHMAGA